MLGRDSYSAMCRGSELAADRVSRFWRSATKIRESIDLYRTIGPMID